MVGIAQICARSIAETIPNLSAIKPSPIEKNAKNVLPPSEFKESIVARCSLVYSFCKSFAVETLEIP